MINNKLRNILKARKITMKELGDKIGITDKGIGLMLKTNSFKVENLQKISKALHLPMSYWFQENDEIPANVAGFDEQSSDIGINKFREIELLEKRIKDKDQTIEILLKENARLQDLLEKYQSELFDTPKRRKTG